MTDDAFVDSLCDEADAGLVSFALVGGPCETHSPARNRILRPLDEPEGALEGLTESEQASVDRVNTIFANAARFALAIDQAEGGFIFEHPACRAILGTPFHWPKKANRASLRHLPCMVALQRATGAVWIFAPHCFFGASAQKWSMYLVNPRALPFFPALVEARCEHQRHAEHAYGVDEWGHGRAKGFAQYTPELAKCLGQGALAFAAHAAAGQSDVPPARPPLGEISFGPRLHPVVRSELERVCSIPPRFASFQRRRPVPSADRWTLPFPPAADLPPPPPPSDRAWMDDRLTDSSGSDDETLQSAPLGWQRPTRHRHRIPECLAPRIAYWMLWLPDRRGQRVGLLAILRWRDEAFAAQQRLRAGSPASPPEAISISPLLKHPHFRDRLMDCRNPADCVVVRRSTRYTRHSAPHTDCDAVWRLADEVNWREVDMDILLQWGGGGIESRSACPFATSLGFHHSGVAAGFSSADDIIEEDLDAGRLGGPYSFCPPFEPFVNLPRNVVFQRRPKQADDGTFFEYDKARVTTDGSFAVPGTASADGPAVDDASPNAGVPPEQRTMGLPTAQRHGTALAIVDSAGNGRDVRGAAYSTDRTNAFSYLMTTRGDWRLQGFIWDPPLAKRRQSGGHSPAAAAALHAQWVEGAGTEGWQPRAPLPADRAPGFMCSFVCYFGGAHMPQRFGRIGHMSRSVSRARQRAFDERHPLPAYAQKWSRLRAQLQQQGLLPPGREQLDPADLQSFIDDHGGSALTDITGVPPELAHIPLDLSAMGASDGTPAPLDSRVANHCRIDIGVAMELGFAISLTTQCGDGVVSLGLRLSVQRDSIDCPPMKAASMLHDARALGAAATEGLDRAHVERFVCRAANLSQAFPRMLPHLHAGYTVSCAGPRSRRTRTVVHLSAGSRTDTQFRELLDVVARELSANDGVPLVHAAPRVGDALVIATDASRSGDSSGIASDDATADDGVGGFAFDPADPQHVILVSEPWPSRVRQAMAVSAARRAHRAQLQPLRCPMPAGELFGGWAVAEAVQEALGRRFPTIGAVGDCRPAASALTQARSRSSTMRPLLASMPLAEQDYLGVWVPREFNTTADGLSHPSQLPALMRAITAAGMRWTVAHIPRRCWEALLLAIEASDVQPSHSCAPGPRRTQDSQRSPSAARRPPRA